MYKLVAADMDETFLGFDHSVPQANVEAILRMRELGVLFVPASGGPTRPSWAACAAFVRVERHKKRAGVPQGHMDITLIEGDSIEFLRDVPLSKCLYVYENLDLLHELALTMDPALVEGLDTTFSSGRYYEFNPTGVNKGSGLRQLANMLGIDISETIGCGDSANDMAMLEAAGVGVVVSNATSDAVAVSDYQATSSCDDGVFAEVLERFIEPEHR